MLAATMYGKILICIETSVCTSGGRVTWNLLGRMLYKKFFLCWDLLP